MTQLDPKSIPVKEFSHAVAPVVALHSTEIHVHVDEEGQSPHVLKAAVSLRKVDDLDLVPETHEHAHLGTV